MFFAAPKCLVTAGPQTIGIDIPAGRTSLCCIRGDEARLARLTKGYGGDQAVIAARLEELAAEHGSVSRTFCRR